MSDQTAPPMIDLRLLPAAATTWAATWWATTHHTPRPLIGSLLLSAAACAASYTHSHQRTHPPRHALTPPRSLRLALTLLLASLATALTVATTAAHQYATDPARRDPGPIRVRVLLETDPAPASSGQTTTHHARVRVTHVARDDNWLPSHTYALASAPHWRNAARGDTYELTGTLDTHFAADPPSIGTIRATRAHLLTRPTGLGAWARATHQAFSHACQQLSPDARGLVPGMAIGDDRLTPKDLADAMKTTSLTHLTAVSGTHIVIVLTVLTLVLPARKLLRITATATTLATIVLLVGPQPSVIRSVCVASVATLGLILGREGQAIAALSAVVIATLLIDPWASHSYGFALSTLAALAVIGPATAIIRRSRRHLRSDTTPGKTLRRLIEMVCVPAFAELFTAPLIVSLSGSVPTWAIPANIIAEPAVPIATVAGLAGALIAPINTPAASACAHIASCATGWIAQTARLLANLPAATTPIPQGSTTLLTIYACVATGWALWRAWKHWAPPEYNEDDTPPERAH